MKERHNRMVLRRSRQCRAAKISLFAGNLRKTIISHVWC